MTWWCMCPEVMFDAAGRPHPCRSVAEIDHDYELPSTSGPLTHVVTVCQTYRHRVTILLEDLHLLV